jgi:hypothetical protein
MMWILQFHRISKFDAQLVEMMGVESTRVTGYGSGLLRLLPVLSLLLSIKKEERPAMSADV